MSKGATATHCRASPPWWGPPTSRPRRCARGPPSPAARAAAPRERQAADAAAEPGTRRAAPAEAAEERTRQAAAAPPSATRRPAGDSVQSVSGGVSVCVSWTGDRRSEHAPRPLLSLRRLARWPAPPGGQSRRVVTAVLTTRAQLLAVRQVPAWALPLAPSVALLPAPQSLPTRPAPPGSVRTRRPSPRAGLRNTSSREGPLFDVALPRGTTPPPDPSGPARRLCG